MEEEIEKIRSDRNLIMGAIITIGMQMYSLLQKKKIVQKIHLHHKKTIYIMQKLKNT